MVGATDIKYVDKQRTVEKVINFLVGIIKNWLIRCIGVTSDVHFSFRT